MPDKWKIFATLFGTVYFGDVHLKNSQKQINTRWRIQYFGEKNGRNVEQLLCQSFTGARISPNEGILIGLWICVYNHVCVNACRY